MTNTEFLRQRLYQRIAAVGHATETLESLRQTEWSSLFETLMRNRLLVGRFRYGLMGDPAKANYDHVKSMKERLRLYEKTGNLEHLVDVANLCLVEFVHSKHPRKHFAAADDAIHCEVKK